MKKALLLLLSAAIGIVGYAQDAAYTLKFGPAYNSASVQNYTTTWKSTVDGFSWTLFAFNNNQNQWNFAATGHKTSVLSAYISTDAAMPEAIDKIVVNAKIKSGKTADLATVTSAVLLIADNADYTNATSVNLVPYFSTLGTTDTDITIPLDNPAANKFYKFQIDTGAKASANGWLQVNTVSYYEAAGTTTLLPAGLAFSAATAEAYLGQDFTAPKLTFATDGEIEYESSNEAVAMVDANTGVVEVKGVGTATITATSEPTETYKGGKASYTLTVLDPNNIAIYKSALGADWTFDNPDNAAVWNHDNTYGLKGTAYISGATIEATAYAISPVIDLQAWENAKLNFQQAVNNYKASGASITLEDLVADKYCQIAVREAGATEWTVVAVATAPTAFGWTFYDNEPVSLADYSGKQIQVAFVYTSSATVAGTWEVKNIAISGAKAAVSKDEAGLAYAKASYVTAVGAEFATPELTNPNNLAVTYDSDKKAVATVAADGTVTIVAPGKAVITASFAGNDDYFAGQASYTITVADTYASIAAFYAGVPANGYGVLDFDMVATYVNGSNCYAASLDGTAATLIYGTTPYQEGDKIAGGWIGQYSPYIGLPEIKPVGTLAAATEQATFTVPEVTSVSTDDVNRILVIKNVTFEAATPTAKTNFDGTIGETTVQFRNNFEIASADAGTYDVKAAVGIYNTTLQVYPIEYKKPSSGLEGVSVDTNATVEYYNLQGVRVAYPAAGQLVIRRQGNTVTKVIVK